MLITTQTIVKQASLASLEQLVKIAKQDSSATLLVSCVRNVPKVNGQAPQAFPQTMNVQNVLKVNGLLPQALPLMPSAMVHALKVNGPLLLA